MRSLSIIRSNSEKCHIKGKHIQRQTRWDLQVTTYNELHPLIRFGSNLTTLSNSWVGHMLYVDNNLHLF